MNEIFRIDRLTSDGWLHGPEIKTEAKAMKRVLRHVEAEPNVQFRVLRLSVKMIGIQMGPIIVAAEGVVEMEVYRNTLPNKFSQN